jgi:pyrroloquinoline quinone (PQQ) biosynthesis protein C
MTEQMEGQPMLERELEEWLALEPNLASRLAADREPGTRSKLADEVADILLARFRDPLTDYYPGAWSASSEALIQSYGRVRAISAESLLEKYEVVADCKVEDLPSVVEEVSRNAHCSDAHPLFDFIENHATKPQLSQLLYAENLCDLNFVHLLSVIVPGMTGKPAAEMAENLWDEWGHGAVDKFHRNIRLEMMSHAGIRIDDSRLAAADYLPEEVAHFNAYALNGAVRRLNLRLVGMMYSTEFLVPRQLRAVIAGWRRVGTPDGEIQYLLDHFEGDVEHAAGWADSVIRPILVRNESAARELLIGALEHVDLLGKLYDTIYQDLVAATVRG